MARRLGGDGTDRVTVITPTLANRRDKLLAACASVDAQTFTDWCHLIVPNGPSDLDPEEKRRKVVPLGRPHKLPGHWNRLLGGLLAATEYTAYLDDDNLWLPRHLEVLVDALDTHPEAGFAYAQMVYSDGSTTVGDADLAPGHAINFIDTSMVCHRTSLLSEVASWYPFQAPEALRYALDGFLVDTWLRQGVRPVFVPEVTVRYLAQGYWLDGGGVR